MYGCIAGRHGCTLSASPRYPAMGPIHGPYEFVVSLSMLQPAKRNTDSKVIWVTMVLRGSKSIHPRGICEPRALASYSLLGVRPGSSH